MDKILQYLTLFPILPGILFISNTTLLLQLKEYRYDRLLSHIKEKGVLSIYLTKPSRSSPSIRNMLTIALSGGIFLLYIFIVLRSFDFSAVTVLLAVIGAILSPFFVAFSNLAILPFASFYRQKIIDRAKNIVAKSQATFIGITGSYGKTSTKDLLTQVLSHKYNVASTKANYNTETGVAISICDSLTQKTEYFIAEVGAYKLGEISITTDYICPRYAILTAIGDQHLDLFGSKENQIYAKSELLRSLPEDGIAFINASALKHVRSSTKSKIISYSTTKKYINANKDNQNFIFADNITFNNNNGYSATIRYKDKAFDITTALISSHDILNLLPAIAIGIELGMSEKDIQRATKGIKNKSSRLFICKGVNDIQFVCDYYSSNPAGFLSAIDALNNFATKEKYAVSKGLIELGPAKTKAYKTILRKLEGHNIKLLTTDKYFMKLATKSVQLFDDEFILSHYLSKNCKETDTVLIEGRFHPLFIETLKLKHDTKNGQ